MCSLLFSELGLEGAWLFPFRWQTLEGSALTSTQLPSLSPPCLCSAQMCKGVPEGEPDLLVVIKRELGAAEWEPRWGGLWGALPPLGGFWEALAVWFPMYTLKPVQGCVPVPVILSFSWKRTSEGAALTSQDLLSTHSSQLLSRSENSRSALCRGC